MSDAFTRYGGPRHEGRFQKVPGQVYHLYRAVKDPETKLYFSLLSPADWRDHAPDPFVGSFRLEADLSWTPSDDLAARDARAEGARRLLGEGT